MAILVGVSVLASGWLRLVPMAVLFGVFLYMGISALGGIQFWDRCILLLKPVKHHPQVPYVRRVSIDVFHSQNLNDNKRPMTNMWMNVAGAYI